MPIIGTCSGLIDILEYKVRGRRGGERGRRIERKKRGEREKEG